MSPIDLQPMSHIPLDPRNGRKGALAHPERIQSRVERAKGVLHTLWTHLRTRGTQIRDVMTWPNHVCGDDDLYA